MKRVIVVDMRGYARARLQRRINGYRNHAQAVLARMREEEDMCDAMVDFKLRYAERAFEEAGRLIDERTRLETWWNL